MSERITIEVELDLYHDVDESVYGDEVVTVWGTFGNTEMGAEFPLEGTSFGLENETLMSVHAYLDAFEVVLLGRYHGAGVTFARKDFVHDEWSIYSPNEHDIDDVDTQFHTIWSRKQYTNQKYAEAVAAESEHEDEFEDLYAVDDGWEDDLDDLDDLGDDHESVANVNIDVRVEDSDSKDSDAEDFTPKDGCDCIICRRYRGEDDLTDVVTPEEGAKMAEEAVDEMLKWEPSTGDREVEVEDEDGA